MAVKPPALRRGLGIAKRPRAKVDAHEPDHLDGEGIERLKREAHSSLAKRKRRQEAQLKKSNQELEALAASDIRAVTLHALRFGISARLGSGEPRQTAVAEGAMLVAQAMHRDGVKAADLRSLLALWRRRVDSADLLTAAQQLLGKDFEKLTYPRGTPLADFCEVLFGSAQEVGDLIAAGGIVSSVHRKLELIESSGRPPKTTTTRKKKKKKKKQRPSR